MRKSLWQFAQLIAVRVQDFDFLWNFGEEFTGL